MRAFKSNPFVVLADITIALCFIFAVYAISMTALNSNMKLFFDREERQSAISESLEANLLGWHLSHYGQTLRRVPVKKVVNKVEQNYDSYQDAEGRELAQLWKNASFMRISVFQPLFVSGTQTHRDTVQAKAFAELYQKLGSVLSERRNDFNYVYLHGITESEEWREYSQSVRSRYLYTLSQREFRAVASVFGLAEGLPRPDAIKEILRVERQEWARKLSVERASRVFALMQTAGLVSRYEEGESAKTGLIAKFVIPYGTGVSLYTRADMDVGRVDILVFFGDVSSDIIGVTEQ